MVLLLWLQSFKGLSMKNKGHGGFLVMGSVASMPECKTLREHQKWLVENKRALKRCVYIKV